MKRFPLAALFAATSVFMAGSASGQNAFEGVIEVDMSAAGQAMSMTQSVKGNRIHQQMQGPMGAMVTIVDTESMDVITLMTAQKMYMKMNMSDLMAMASAMGQQQMQRDIPETDPADFKATGRKETIAGHECEHYELAQEGMTMDLCVATGLGYMPFASPGAMSAGGTTSYADQAKYRARFKDGFMPLSTTATMDGQTMTMVVKRVERKSIDDAIFEVPAGYTEMKMPGRGM